MQIIYQPLTKAMIDTQLFAQFDRYQKVTRCWRKEQGQFVLKEIAFTEQWDDADIAYLVQCLRRTVEQGGAVYGALDGGCLCGFCSVEREPFGSRREYVQLSSLHVSFEHRGRGIGRRLFALAARYAKQVGAAKLYISSHSAEETQAFYKAVGCVEAREYIEQIVQKEPCDCQLEYSLKQVV